ncbi:MAG: hypothetical protein IC227_08055 [Enterococcus lacertideformus]|uniref:Uncharacterized protein n=1 Tax=Enterococcus lacertideformus TaxID=2771493 RepID=A0A931AZ49_9ENTE|nr:hypothetical protein [Enterococcus lacertideformus]
MVNVSLLFLLVFVGLIGLRRSSKTALTKRTLFLEMVLNATLSYLAALILWLGYSSFNFTHTSGTVWLLWLLMFVCGVIGVRTLGKRLTYANQTVINTTITIFDNELAYHASVFWKLIAVITGITFLTVGSLPNCFILISISFTMTVAIIMESAVKLFQLQN